MKRKKGSFFSDVLGGDFFSKESVVKQLPFLLYVVFLLMIYISNTYIAEDMKLDLIKTTQILEERRVEYISIRSEITTRTKQSELAAKLKNKGIKETVEPVKKIIIKQK
ncbi:MAG: hypothetical protein J6X10_00100 [Bacteroidales bacterium]|nr:hypothetical protein [Bacteroidales bacterium]